MQKLLIVGPGEGKKVDLGGLGVDFKIWGEATSGQLTIVEHPMEPRRLVPPHVHHAEDELSYVLEGRFGVRVGDVHRRNVVVVAVQKVSARGISYLRECILICKTRPVDPSTFPRQR